VPDEISAGLDQYKSGSDTELSGGAVAALTVNVLVTEVAAE
jgi:hypothetical protein